MTNPKDPNSPPIPVPETMEEFREMARKAMAVSAETAADLKKSREEMREDREARAEEWRKYREARAEEMREYRERQEKERREDREARAEEWRKYNEAREKERREDRAAWRKLEETTRKVFVTSGRNDENTGRILEHELIARVKRDGKIAWMAADEIFPYLKRHVGRRVVDEFDLFIVNGEEAMLVEVKRVLRAEDVRRFAEADLTSFRRHFAGMVGDRVLYGALAFALEDADEGVRKRVRKKAEDAGILLIHLVGESNMKILNPDREKLLAVAP